MAKAFITYLYKIFNCFESVEVERDFFGSYLLMLYDTLHFLIIVTYSLGLCNFRFNCNISFKSNIDVIILPTHCVAYVL